MIYSSEDVLKGLKFWADDVPDQDSERAADLARGLRGLTEGQVTALKMSAQGFTLSQISKEVYQTDHPMKAMRLVVRARQELRALMNNGGANK